MKTIIFLILILGFKISSAQTPTDDLNGKIFRGIATEQTPPDVDRMPIFFSIVLKFDNGKLQSTTLNNYSINETAYTAEIDGRRMIALKVVTFKGSTTGIVNGENVNIEISGEVFGDAKLSGDMIVKYPDGREVKFVLNATAE